MLFALLVAQDRHHDDDHTPIVQTAATHSQLSLWQRLMHRFSRRASHG
ncbi:hypothetical protein PQH03_17955 [Ralstonia insidiosa]|jgi:hypothetical protein|nr:hypothetical protein [Ralstonia insidiosa]MBX3771046.1 hypothetical protein [Ralstonia pickettii]NOZ17811.1 hypothetical protein [Betaproteobacteria bacterium]MBC9964334.1 hypothetical protein [Ralstonia insidiosa]MBX3810445.1 hypothetical protein [Ralstonia pickettii]MBX3815694.1 hypothetical protein [Ralstonia insidiosa]